MRRTLAYLVPALVTSTLLAAGATGCALYFDGDDDDPCLYGDPEPAPTDPLPSLRNPYTGLCESYWGGGGGGTCDPACGPCDEPASPPEPVPSWGLCSSECSLLDEPTCLATPGCRGAYLEGGTYLDCWAVDMTGPVQGGGCEGLDAWECSRHDDCIAIHADICAVESPADGDIACTHGEFVACADEVTEPLACEHITGEQQCVDRTECTPYYEGSECTCDAAGNCTCATWTFTRCEPSPEPGN